MGATKLLRATMLGAFVLAAPMEGVARSGSCVVTEAPPDKSFQCSPVPCPAPAATSDGLAVPLSIQSMKSNPHTETLTFRAIPDLSEFDSGTTVPLTIQQEGYEPWLESVKVPVNAKDTEEICVTMVPLRNIEVKLMGEGASATIFATTEDGKQVDHCSIDTVVGKDRCGLHVPADLTESNKPVHVSLRVVGTMNAEFATLAYAGKVTQNRGERAPKGLLRVGRRGNRRLPGGGGPRTLCPGKLRPGCLSRVGRRRRRGERRQPGDYVFHHRRGGQRNGALDAKAPWRNDPHRASCGWGVHRPLFPASGRASRDAGRVHLRMVSRRAAMICATGAALVGCDNLTPFEPPTAADDHVCVPFPNGGGTPTIRMDFASVGDDFFAAPFPAFGRKGDSSRTGSDGSRFPVSTALGDRLRQLLPTDGYAISAGIFFELSAAADASRFPDALNRQAGAMGAGDVLLFPLDDPQTLASIRVAQTNAPDGSHVLLNILPMQGRPLHENTDYVAIVKTHLAGAQGATMAALCGAYGSKADGQALPQVGLGAADVGTYTHAIGVATAHWSVNCHSSPDRDTIAAISVFHTGDPTAAMRAARDLARADYAREQGGCTVPLKRDSDGNHGERCSAAAFCVYAGLVKLPQYQRGSPPYLPYLQWGGGWPSSPVPVPQIAAPGCHDDITQAGQPTDPASWTPTWRDARVVVTIPRTRPPPSGYPTVVYVRAGAGTATDPLVDRGPQLYPDCNATTDCRGPAEVLQSVGFAGITIDGPLVGESRLDPGFDANEDLNIYNFLNPIALRDNLRQSAVELTIVPDILKQLKVDMSECEMGEQAGDEWVKGAVTGMASFDQGHLAMLSHSMGSSMSGLALATDPRYRVAILSGAGGSLIENVVYKAKPFPVYVAGSLLELPSDCRIDEFPAPVSLLQWATESSDTEVFARRMVVDEAPAHATWWSPTARSVLMIQGLVDHDILPPIADVMTLGASLDLGLGPNSCFADPLCDRRPVYGEVATQSYPSLADLLWMSGRSYGDLSVVTGNVPWPKLVPRPPNYAGDLTAVVVQHRIDENREPAGQPCMNLNGHEAIYESTLARHQYACFLDDFAHDRTPRVRAAGEELAPCDP